MSSPTKPLSFNSPRASPFRRSPSLSPEKSNPFVRRPSQLGSDRPRSPFARPTSRLSVQDSPSRPTSSASHDSLAPPIAFSHLGTPAASEHEPESEPEHDFSAPPSPSPQSSRPPSPSPASAEPASPVPIHHEPSSPAPASPFHLSPTAARSMRPAAQRTVTSSTQATIRPSTYSSAMTPDRMSTYSSRTPERPSSSYSQAMTSARPSTYSERPPVRSPKAGFAAAAGNYNHVPQPLLRSMRESFEVLDSANSGSINSASVADMLQQMGMDASPRALSQFFPPNVPANVNLGRFLDTLSAPLADMSQPDELNAAFAAFDVDDSGQIDLAELRDALLHTAPDPGAEHLRMSETEIEAIMAQFSARRAFGGKGVLGKDLSGAGGKPRGDVFRYRDFMASISGTGATDASENVAA